MGLLASLDTKFSKSLFHIINIRVTLREKCPNTDLFLVRIFLCSDWIRRFTNATLLKVTLLYGCFLRFLNCTNVSKSRNASHICWHILLNILISSILIAWKLRIIFKFINFFILAKHGWFLNASTMSWTNFDCL